MILLSYRSIVVRSKYWYGDVYSPMKAESIQLQATEWTEDRQTY